MIGALPELSDSASEIVRDNVRSLPLVQRSCHTCVHWRLIDSDAASWCEVYEQTIDSEVYEAEDCFTYERCEEGSQPVLDGDPRGDDMEDET